MFFLVTLNFGRVPSFVFHYFILAYLMAGYMHLNSQYPEIQILTIII